MLNPAVGAFNRPTTSVRFSSKLQAYGKTKKKNIATTALLDDDDEDENDEDDDDDGYNDDTKSTYHSVADQSNSTREPIEQQQETSKNGTAVKKPVAIVTLFVPAVNVPDLDDEITTSTIESAEDFSD